MNGLVFSKNIRNTYLSVLRIGSFYAVLNFLNSNITYSAGIGV